MKNKTITRKVISFIMMMAMAFTMLTATAITASAETTTNNDTATIVMANTSGIITWINNLAVDLKNIGYAVGGVAVIVLGIVLIAGGSQGMQKGKAIAVPILVGVAVLGFGVGTLGTLRSSTASTATAAKSIPTTSIVNNIEQ